MNQRNGENPIKNQKGKENFRSRVVEYDEAMD